MVQEIKKEELKEKLDNNAITIIEVLDPEDYKKRHIKGAINIPYKQIVSEAKKELKKDQAVAVYCSDKDCDASDVAADKLDAEGYENVYHYTGGKKEWYEAGYPVVENQ